MSRYQGVTSPPGALYLGQATNLQDNVTEHGSGRKRRHRLQLALHASFLPLLRIHKLHPAETAFQNTLSSRDFSSCSLLTTSPGSSAGCPSFCHLGTHGLHSQCIPPAGFCLPRRALSSFLVSGALVLVSPDRPRCACKSHLQTATGLLSSWAPRSWLSAPVSLYPESLSALCAFSASTAVGHHL